MGFLDRVLGMLQGQSPKEQLVLTPASALEQLDPLSERIERGFDEKLANLSERFRNESGKTRDNLKKLEAGTLLNKDVEKRHLQIMEGNRNAYIRKIEQFLDAVASIAPLDRANAPQAAEYLRERLESLLKSTQKSYFVLQEFLANESRDIAGNLKAFDRLIAGLKEPLESQEKKLSRIKTVRGQLAGVGRQPEQEEGLRRSARLADDSAAEAEQALDNFKLSKRYLGLSRLRKRHEQLRLEGDGLTDRLAQSLSVIERAMRKYHKISAEPEIVSAVLDASEQVLLLEPKRLEQLLPRLERAISSGELSLKDRKCERSLETIQQLSEELGPLAERFRRLDAELRDAGKELEGHAAAAEEQELLRTVKECAVRARMARESLTIYLESRGKQPEMDAGSLEAGLGELFGRPVRLEMQQDKPARLKP